MSQDLSTRQRKLLRRWHAGKAIKCREITELRAAGLIEWRQGPMAGGGYLSAPFLTDAGKAALDIRGREGATP